MIYEGRYTKYEILDLRFLIGFPALGLNFEQ